MLKLRFRASQKYTCPKHPRQQYDDPLAIPASCSSCHAIANVVRAERMLQEAERKAQNWIAATALSKSAGGKNG